MITAEQIYNATNAGLDIILYYYPQARDAVNNPKTKFRIRQTERTASATLIQGTHHGAKIWKVCDFGDEGQALSPIDIAMKEEGISRFGEAVLKLAQIFDVRDELNRSVNKPILKERDAKADEVEGEIVWELREGTLSPEELKVMGPNVREEHAIALRWHAVKWMGRVKGRKVREEHSTDTYPILLRECVFETEGSGMDHFVKIYKPLNPDKGFRFLYAPVKKKPKRYINGLDELKAVYLKANAEAEAEFFNDPRNENRRYEEQKLDAAYICSGERDAICLKSLGYNPIWFNSETYDPTEQEISQIKKYVLNVYNIPDIDDTGRAKGIALALKYTDIITILLYPTLIYCN